MKKFILCMALVLPFALISCNTKSKKQQQEVAQQGEVVGNDKDEHGCIGSAGYTWSELLQECVRPWEEGVRLNGVNTEGKDAFIIFNADSTQVELILADGSKYILDRREAAKGAVWNQEDDDTYNLFSEDGLFKIEKRQEVLFVETK